MTRIFRIYPKNSLFELRSIINGLAAESKRLATKAKTLSGNRKYELNLKRKRLSPIIRHHLLVYGMFLGRSFKQLEAKNRKTLKITTNWYPLENVTSLEYLYQIAILTEYSIKKEDIKEWIEGKELYLTSKKYSDIIRKKTFNW